MATTAAHRVVIVGTGTAGITAAETLRASGFEGSISVIGEEAELPYRRTALSKDIVAADLSTEKITLRRPEFWSDRAIQLLPNSRVVAVDTDARTVTLTPSGSTADADYSGTQPAPPGAVRTLGYDALVLATGGSPRRFDWLADDVAVLRSREDALAIKAALTGARPLIVIGAGLIGLEVAASAAAAGVDVTVLEATDRPMGRVLPAEVADTLAALHRAHGVALFTGTAVTRATADHVEGVGFTVPEDGYVLAALGTTPNVDVARAAGIELGASGILVDEHLRTSTPGVYGAGDVAEYPQAITGGLARSEHWLTAGAQGKVVAGTILADLGGVGATGDAVGDTTGAPAELATTPVPLAWTIQYGTNIQFVGWPGHGDRTEVDGSLARLDATVRVYSGEVLVGAVCIGRAAAGRQLRQEITECLPARSKTTV